jgi:pimeloyl-ACP methyl ester carboxylesterase
MTGFGIFDHRFMNTGVEIMVATLGIDTRFVTLRNGLTLSYVEQGDPDGIPLIFLHGLSDSLRSFDLVLPHLPPSIHAFALSQRGHGDSGRPYSGYDMSDYAADVAQFIARFDLGSAILVGHSMGTAVAQQFALDYQDLLRGLVLIGSFVSYASNAVMVGFWPEVEALTDPIDPGFALAFQESTLAKPIPQSYLETVVAESLKLPARVWKAAMAGIMAADVTDSLFRISAPTLLIWGEKDAFVPNSDQDLQLNHMPNAALEIFPSTGHAVHWEEPTRVAAHLTDFIDQITG